MLYQNNVLSFNCDLIILLLEGVMCMLSEARKKANKKWNDNNLKIRYDRVQLVLPKGTKQEIQQIAKKQSKSVNAYISDLILNDLNKNS